MSDYYYNRAMDEQINWFADGGCYGDDYDYVRRDTNNFVPDPLYYHRKIKYSLLQETDNAFHIKLKNDTAVWVPKKIVRRRKKKSMYVHAQIFKAILRRADESKY